MLQQLIDELPRDVPLIIRRIYSDKKNLVPLWYVEIEDKNSSHADLLMAFGKAKEKWENGRESQ